MEIDLDTLVSVVQDPLVEVGPLEPIAHEPTLNLQFSHPTQGCGGDGHHITQRSSTNTGRLLKVVNLRLAMRYIFSRGKKLH